jgi:hypothetical protein
MDDCNAVLQQIYLGIPKTDPQIATAACGKVVAVENRGAHRRFTSAYHCMIGLQNHAERRHRASCWFRCRHDGRFDKRDRNERYNNRLSQYPHELPPT